MLDRKTTPPSLAGEAFGNGDDASGQLLGALRLAADQSRSGRRAALCTLVRAGRVTNPEEVILGRAEDEAPGLAATPAELNRAGLVTSASQAGWKGTSYDGAHCQLYAAVVGFATPEVVNWVQATVIEPAAGALRLVRCRPGLNSAPVDPVTWRDGEAVTDFGAARPALDLSDGYSGYGVCHGDAVAELIAARQIVVRETEVGRNDRLWPALRAAAELRAARTTAR